MASRPTDNPNFVEAVKASVARLPPTVASQLRFVLGALNTRLGSLIATGYWNTFPEQPIHVRESTLRAWQRGRLFLWPILARTFLTIGKACWSSTNQDFLRLNGYGSERADAASASTVDFDFLQFEESPNPAIVHTDVVIVGSGCGGAVCAKILAEAGYQVLIVDKGYHQSAEQFPMGPEQNDDIFQGGGAIASADGSTFITAGMCWGGGGTVNWSASLQTPSYIRQEWANSGLQFFQSAEYQNSLERVCEAMGVSDALIQQNHANKTLLEGSHILGWRAAKCPQNSGQSVHSCGSRCGRGCRTGKKQGTYNYWLPAARKAGARCIEGFDVAEVYTQSIGQRRKATGLTGNWTSRYSPSSSKPRVQQMIEVQAKKVILAAGAINTPLILQKTQVQGSTNANIGRNLYLHPVALISAIWDEDVKPWEGDIVSSVVSEFENLDGQGHGVKIEAFAMQPYLAMMFFPWNSGPEFKTAALNYRYMTSHIVISRDRDAGSIAAGPGKEGPTINYTPSRLDRGHMVSGLVAAAKMCYVSGAKGIFPAVVGVPLFSCSKVASDRSVNDKDFVKWLRSLEQSTLDPLRNTFLSAHQMGTARMGTQPENSVVDETGKVWGYDDLYVADGSVFPSASGVNPMITIMAIADRITRGVAGSLK
ncbi:long-chain fatty alcohol dehydrogenase [Xylariaceae sp. FL0255]|nr:long-chain fatty alcohol dehydrogenase [Xylariaceae sp. FL0255]